jgi:hypothetical protein
MARRIGHNNLLNGRRIPLSRARQCSLPIIDFIAGFIARTAQLLQVCVCPMESKGVAAAYGRAAAAGKENDV